jgi:hypothetical protein
MYHKNLHVSSLLLLCIIAVYPAQSLKAQSEFGVKGGALYSAFIPTHTYNSLNFDTHSGFELGVFYTKPKLLGPIGFQTEFLYQMKGAHVNAFKSGYGYGYSNGYSLNESSGGYGYEGEGAFVVDKQKYHYFTIPVLLTVSTFKFLDLYGGAEIGYMFAASKDRLRFEDNNNFRAGLAFGAALKLGEKTKLDFRYSPDLTPFYEMGDSKLKSRSFSVSVQQTLFRKLAK